jgi:hypothetical protein
MSLLKRGVKVEFVRKFGSVVSRIEPANLKSREWRKEPRRVIGQERIRERNCLTIVFKMLKLSDSESKSKRGQSRGRVRCSRRCRFLNHYGDDVGSLWLDISSMEQLTILYHQRLRGHWKLFVFGEAEAMLRPGRMIEGAL